MDINAALVADCSVATMFQWVHDLADYSVWLDLVHRAEIDPNASGDSPAWLVELRARVGPLARSKRLRMVRTQCVDGQLARFERSELDGRSHSIWVLQAELEPVRLGEPLRVGEAGLVGDGSVTRLTMTLHYGGGLWSGAVLERVLNEQIIRGRDRLKTLVETQESAR